MSSSEEKMAAGMRKKHEMAKEARTHEWTMATRDSDRPQRVWMYKMGFLVL